MSQRQIIKHIVDLLMTIFLLAQMAYLLVGQEIHERMGAGMLVLFIAHHVLNWKWILNLKRGPYRAYRLLQTLLVFLVFLSMLGSMVSGIMMSRYVFDFLPIQGGMSFARILHMLCAYWGFIFLSAHLGLHWGMVMGMVRKASGVRATSRVRTAVLRITACGIAAYGVFAFVKHRIADYLFLRSMFVFFDFEQPLPQFFAEYIAMMGLWIFLAYYTGTLLQKRAAHSSNPAPVHREEERNR